MIKKIIPILFLLILSSCEKQEVKLVINCNEKIEIKDLFIDEKYEKLKNDEDYVEYISDFHNAHVSVIKSLYNTKFVAEDELAKKNKNGISSDRLTSSFSILTSFVSGGLKAKFSMSKKDKLFNSFSDDKKKLAIEFEEKVKKCTSKSENTALNTKSDVSPYLINYKSFLDVIKDDHSLYSDLDDVTDELDELLLNFFELRRVLYLNVVFLDKKPNFNGIIENGLKILDSDGEYYIHSSSKLLNTIFKSTGEILKEVKEIENKYKRNLKDSSAEKKGNFEYIINEIKRNIRDQYESIYFENEKTYRTKNTNKKVKNIKTYGKYGIINGTNIIIRQGHSTKSKIIGSFKKIGERVEIIGKYKTGKTITLINTPITLTTKDGNTYNLKKGKAVDVIAESEEGILIGFKNKKGEYKQGATNTNYVSSKKEIWYKVKRQSGEIGWVFGKFVKLEE